MQGKYAEHRIYGSYNEASSADVIIFKVQTVEGAFFCHAMRPIIQYVIVWSYNEAVYLVRNHVLKSFFVDFGL